MDYFNCSQRFPTFARSHASNARGAFMETILQDLRFAIRTLARQRGFTAIAVLTLAIGIGANTAIYSVVNATLLRPLPYRDPDRLMRVALTIPSVRGRAPQDDMVWSYPKYEAFRK